MSQRLTETAIARVQREAIATGTRRELSDAGHAGLRLRLTPGSATWTLACRDVAGRMRRFTLGAYPTLGLAAAREAARALRHQVRQEGADPIAARRAERARVAAEATAPTLTALLDLYRAQKAPGQRSWGEYQRGIARVWGPFLGAPLGTLTLPKLQLAADAYAAPQQAAAACRYLRPVLKWASAPGRAYLPRELADLSPPATVRRRDRVLSREELARLLPVLREAEADGSPYAAGLHFLLLTLLRRGEADGARWRDIDWQAKTLTIAAERSKNKQPHVLPLSRQALALLRGRWPGADADPAALIFATATGGRLGSWDRETKQVQRACGVAGWHRHDLRRTGATLLGELGETPDVIEATLNHAAIRSPLAALYNRARYRPQVAAALQRLADALDGIEAGGAEVLPLTGGRR